MIVDTSALVAIIYEEPGADELFIAVTTEPAKVPAPVVVEFLRVTDLRGLAIGQAARELLVKLESNGLSVVPFTGEDANIAGTANLTLGKGMKQGGKLNLLDLMVYAAAKQRGEPILCTGYDFIGLDVAVHPASRTG